jgi:mannose-6-phosphate isomerase
MQIYKFNSILKPVLWGGDKLLAFKRLPACDEPIGESWELSALQGRESVVTNGEDAGMTLSQLVHRYGADLVGEDVYRRFGDSFPLLIKLIDANRDLSIQVHPDEELAHANHGCSGKNEMWYILHADDGAIIHTGFNRDLTPEEFDLELNQGNLMNVINATPSQPGDVFFIPAGQIHTIGAGNFVVEIQQSCDITYRVWDYDRRDADGNLRQLHTQQAREALSFKAFDGFTAYSPNEATGITPLVKCPEFEVCRLDYDDGYELPLTPSHSFVALVCLEGDTTLMADGMPPVTLRQGETALVPAIAQGINLLGSARLLMATVPPAGHEDMNNQ